MPTLLIWALVAIAVAVLAYWLLVTTEGTYLGPRVVALLYDWVARSYNRIKNLRAIDEAQHIGLPLAARLEQSGEGCVLDLACGTGRVALALRLSGGWEGMIVGLDRSSGMLREAAADTRRAHVTLLLVCGDAQHLPFADGSMAAVTCLEAIEFFGHPAQVLAECWRVLRPGGVLLTSNRVGQDARLLPWRHAGRGRQERLLRSLGFVEVDTARWQVHYDLIWAHKPQDNSTPGALYREA